MSENKRAFVTGGGGYIGNCLCEALVARGYTVTAFDVRYLEEKRYNDSVHRVQVRYAVPKVREADLPSLTH